MNALLMCWLAAAAPAQELTWYEVYERGEKRFEKGEYALCLGDMDAALGEKPEPMRNQFTRAMQKIDYKPFYYQALSHYRLGNLDRAFEVAQKAFAGEVVRDSPLLQADLAPILAEFRERVQQLVQRNQAEERLIASRTRLLRLISEDRLAEARDILAAMPPEDASRFEDIEAALERQRVSENQYVELVDSMAGNIEALLARGEPDKARELFNAVRDELTPARASYLEGLVAEGERLAAAQASAGEPAEAEPAPPEEPDADEPESELDPEDVQRRLESFRDALRRNESVRMSLNDEVARMRAENRDLQARLAEQDAAAPTFSPQLFLSLKRLDARGLLVEGQAVSPLLIREWRMSLNGRLVAVPPPDYTQQDFVLTLNHQLQALDFGRQFVSFVVVDELGREAKTQKVFTLRPPWFRRPTILGATALIAALLLYYWISLRALRRKRARLRHFNPYIAGSPIRDNLMFYGRDDLVHRIQGQVHNNSFMIHGDRRIGKTSLLLQLKKNLSGMDAERYRFFPVFIDLQGVEEANLFHHMMGELLLQAADWEVALDGLSYADEAESYQSRPFSRDLKKIIQRLQERESRRVMMVLLMDEVDVLNEFGEKTNQKLRGVFMKDFAEHLTCVMAGIHLKREWESSGSPWYNFFEEIPVATFNRKNARALIVDPVRGVFAYKADAVDLILNKTACHPYLIQKVCVSVIGEKLKQNRFTVTRGDVDAALRKLDEEQKRNRAT